MTRLKLVLLTALLITLGTAGCGTRHVAIPSGATGIYLGSGKYAFPNAKGELEVGQYKPEPSDLVRRPKNTQEVIDTLKAAGINVQEPAPSK